MTKNNPTASVSPSKQRLHVVIAHAGIASRRKAEELITAGNVRVNGSPVKKQGMMVNPAKDKIEVDGKLIQTEEKSVVLLLNKPKNTISSSSDEAGRRTVIDIARRWWKTKYPAENFPRLYPVGRLDNESEGLIILTNEGEMANQLTHPSFAVPKTYQVLIQSSPSNTAIQKLQHSMRFKEGIAKLDSHKLLRHEEGNTWIEVTLHQGFNRQIRRMCGRAGLVVLRLIRIKHGEYELGNLKPGEIKQVSVV